MTSPRLAIALCLWGVASTLHCSGPRSETPPATATDAGASDAAPAGRMPSVHRAASTPCLAPRPAGGASSATGSCKTDADCTTGKNGRCVFGPTFELRCSYDECTVDADCGAGVCDCRNETKRYANACYRGNCVTDADCSGGYCSPSGVSLWDNCHSNVPAGAFGFFCHTREDACIDDADCGEGSTCLFSPEARRWQCLAKRCTR